MTASSGLQRPAWRGAWVPVGIVVAVTAALVGVVALSQFAGSSDEPPPAPAFAGLPPAPITVMDVKQRDGDTLTLVRDGGAEVPFTAGQNTRIERLQPINADDIRTGDTLTVVGIPNEVLSFSIHYVVVMDDVAETVDGTGRSEGGFAGHEASVDRGDRPVIGGVVASADGDEIVFAGPDGPVSLRLNAEADARVFRLEAVEVGAIRDGDRLAADFEAASVDALLAMPPPNG